MNPICAPALEVQDFCRARRWRFCFIGGIAVQRWGEPRLTQAVDLTVLTGFGTERSFVSALLDRFRGRRSDAEDFALRHRVLLLESSTGTPIDVALAAMPFEERAIERASEFEIDPGFALSTCGAEDLIVFKTFAGRERDWFDIEGVAMRQGSRPDETLIWAELTPLLDLKEDPTSAHRLRRLLLRARD
jgi:hypothetical protein